MAVPPRIAHGNLPHSLTALIGRETEVARLKSLSGGARLLTLIGTAGVGKTRLAIGSAAEIVSRHPGGAWFVDVAPLSDGSRIPHAVAAVLGIAEHSRRPILDSLVSALRESNLLLVLDNCEHLVDDCARLTEILLRSSAGLCILATSREPLGVEGEMIFTVNPLPLPDPTWTDWRRIASSPAVRMFISRAALRQPGFQVDHGNASVIAAICRRLDGLPLALELSAAHIGHVPADEILLRLERRFELLTGSRTAPMRQKTLRATLDWSYALLPDHERTLFRGLAVFGGSFDAEAVAAVCTSSAVSIKPLGTLWLLIDKSMLMLAEPFEGKARFRLLETLREYARELLEESGGWEQTRTLHAEHFLAVAEEASERLERDDQVPPLDRLTTDYDNLRAALEWSRLKAIGLSPRLAAALGWFWYHRSHHEEGRAWLAAALEVENGATPIRAMLLRQAGLLAYRKGDFASARQLLDEAIGLERAGGDRIRLALAMVIQSLVLLADGDSAEAESQLAGVIAIGDETRNRRLSGDAFHFLALIATQRGDLLAARAHIDTAIEIGRQTQRMHMLAHALSAGAMVRIQQGELPAAQGLLEESIQIRAAFRDRYSMGIDLDRAAELAARQRRWERAIRLIGAADARYQAIGDAPTPHTRAIREGWLPAAQRRLGSRALRLSDEGGRLSDEDAVEYVITDRDELANGSTRSDGIALTKREHEVVRLVVAGLTNREIAGRLGISERTVDGHVEHIRDKLGVRSRAQIAAWAVAAGTEAASTFAGSPTKQT
jgi:predicted ATPase/DNA-binding CsgD family transcriptional regulator